MNLESVQLLRENVMAMESALHWLERSYRICHQIGVKADYSAEEYGAFETLTSRYARIIDLIVCSVRLY